MSTMFVHLFLFIAMVTRADTKPGAYMWHAIKSSSSLHPGPRFGSITWVDDQHWLWLFGGNNISGSSKTEANCHLSDLWKFNPDSTQWHHVSNLNVSGTVQYSNSLSCFCGGLAYLLGCSFRKMEQFYQLWIYNISINSWSTKELPELVKQSHKCLALWCNQKQISVSLLCMANNSNTPVQLWTYLIKTNKWTSLNVTGSGNSTKRVLKDISKSKKYFTWIDTDGKEYIYFWSSGKTSKSTILSVVYTKMASTVITSTGHHCREGFIQWTDLNCNLHLTGGKKCIDAQVYTAEWMFNITSHKWLSMDLKRPDPSTRSYACSWMVGDYVWMYGGYIRDGNGSIVILQDMWFRKRSNHAVLAPEYHLPGDTLGLSVVDKLVISGFVLLVVMAISVRLCYKRELSQMLLKLKRHRVPYQQLSQESDKSSRL